MNEIAIYVPCNIIQIFIHIYIHTHVNQYMYMYIHIHTGQYHVNSQSAARSGLHPPGADAQVPGLERHRDPGTSGRRVLHLGKS